MVDIFGGGFCQGVLGTVIVDKEGQVLKTSLTVGIQFLGIIIFVLIVVFYQQELTNSYATLIPGLTLLARNMVRDLDPQNDLEFLRLRSDKYEIMVAPYAEFCMIVIQYPSQEI
eukprot:TRINITY_DN395_c0_g1_i3.p2 TRINITY_DN395_c0_g1~~TRINITY_DN395_c0_g1_i3.p2  ORF type:complete len:114 (-),score=6.08 TRINITY_DN395_c0_g1_i3:42-383(-)